MGQKIGEEFVRSQFDLGRRELGGFLFDGSNIAQPSYPLRGNYGPPKSLETPTPDEKPLTYEELHPVEASRDDLDREDRDLGLHRE